MQGWEDVRDAVLARLRTRQWAPGDAIPNEAALAEEFGVARATVNRALQDLAAAGLLERRRRAGTRVARHPVRRATLDIPVIRLEVEGRGQSYGLSLLSSALDRPPAAVAARMGLAPGTRLLHLVTLHLADGHPHVHEDRWLNPQVLPDPPPDFAALSANEWLVENVSFLSGDIAFSAAPAGPDEAAALRVAEGAALFVVDRMTLGPDGAITLVRLSYAPGYRMQTTL